MIICAKEGRPNDERQTTKRGTFNPPSLFYVESDGRSFGEMFHLELGGRLKVGISTWYKWLLEKPPLAGGFGFADVD